MKKSPRSKTRQAKASIKGGINIQGNVNNSNNIIGNNNKILINAEQSKLPSLYQLPPKVADFTGRKALLDDILRDFEESQGATINGLTGMGGIGKTALGLEIAHQLAEKYPDGQIFLDLKGTTSPLSAIDIMRHVILSFEPTADLRTLDEGNIARAYRSVLHDKKVLLYFDNARLSEQIVNLQPPTSCAVLVTSRWIFPLAGLTTHKIGIFNEDEASEFLQELCPRINKEESNALAWACGYLPLALRIAGSFLQVNNDWQVGHYIERLATSKKRIETFQESRKEAEMPEELDLISTFDLSYKQLNNSEQRYWRMLSVFPVSFEWAAAMHIWGIEENETKRLLGVFRRYSLIEFNETLLRYESHDLLNEFAQTKIRNAEVKLAKSKHSIYYSKAIDSIAMFAFSGEDHFIQALKVLDLEWENINTGFWFAASKNNAEHLEAVSTYSKPIDILRLRLHPLEMIKWSTQAVIAARKLNDTYSLAGHYGDLGIAYLDLGKIEKSIQCHENSLKIVQNITDERTKDLLTSNALGNLGQAYESKGDFKSAKQYYEKALILSKKHDNSYSEAMDLLNLGSVKGKIGENKEAIEYILEAKEIFEQLGHIGKVGSCLITLGNIHTKLHQLELALAHLERARKIYIDIGDINNLGACIQNIGNINMEQGEYDAALDYFKQAMEIATFSNDSIGIAQRMVNIGSALFNSQKQSEAIPYFEQAILISKEIGAHELTFVAISNLLVAYLKINNKEKATEIISSAIDIFPEESDYIRKIKSMQRHLTLFDGRSWKDLSELEQVLWIVGEVESSINTNSSEEAYEFVSRLISDDDVSQNFRELGRILQKYVKGDEELDLSILPNEFANIVRSELKISN
jgi:tetratricopeptide (TPR) repeat protein